MSELEEFDWIACSERLPTEADEDCNGTVWSAYNHPITRAKAGPNLSSSSWVTIFSKNCLEAMYWMPTGLRKPEPPEPRNGKQ